MDSGDNPDKTYSKDLDKAVGWIVKPHRPTATSRSLLNYDMYATTLAGSAARWEAARRNTSIVRHVR